ncbi:MAG: hypothetical protein II920_07195, partial [Clostridia bacterium]|nr:hypothetical protein [Clostridia bacterium]
SGQSVFNNKQTDWSVEYSVQLKDAASDEPAYYKLSSYSDTSSGHKGTVTTDIIADSGTYVVHLKATNNDTGAVLTKDVTVEIEDEEPQLVEDELENKEFGILKTYYAAALDPDEYNEIDLADHYSDRKDEERGRELTFSTEQLSSRYSIQGSKIRIYTNLFKENLSIVISAEDSNHQANNNGKIQVVYIDFASFVQSYNDRGISLKAEGEDTYLRFDTIEYDVSYEIPTTKSARDMDVSYDGVTVIEKNVKDAIDEMYPEYLKTVEAEYTISYLGAEGEATSNARGIYSGKLSVGSGVKKLKIDPSESLKQDGETVKAGTYVIKLTLYGGLGSNRQVISECEKRFVIKNTVPYDKGAIPGSFEHTIPWKGSERAEDDRIFIDLKELASVEPDEKITFTVNMEASGKEDVYRLYRLPEGGYLLSAAAVEDATPVQDNRLVWATGDKNASYGLYADAAGHGRKSLTVKVSDDDNAGFEKEITLTTLYRYEKEIIIAALALIALIALLLLYKLIRYLLKPAFSENDLIKVTYNGRDTRFRLQSWKKSGITLREIMIYAGVAFAGDISLKDCDDIVFMPAKGKNDFAVKLAKNKGPVLIMGGAEQNAGFKVPEGTAVTVKLNSEESMNIVRVSQ